MRLLLLLSLSTSLVAQSWSQQTTATDPGQIRDAAMAYHVSSGNTVLFGGWPALNGTWLFDGADWTQASPAASPPGRSEFAMAADVARGVVVMFGGRTGGSVAGDTWEWDGGNWTNVTPASSPPARQGHVMAYDWNRGVTVMFGGTTNVNGPFELTDTWEWDGSTWTQVATASAPSESLSSCMCFDGARGVCVLTGGTSLFGAPDQKTWEFDGSNWADRTAQVGPAPSATPGLGVTYAQMVFDSGRNVCVLYGGRTPNGTFSTDTFEYDGSAWTVVGSGTPSSRTRYAMAFDTALGQAVLYGGLTGNFQTWYQETWTFGGGVAADYQTFGNGCSGSAGVPSNTALALPQLGQTLTVEVGNMPAPEVMALVFGLSIVSPSVDLGVIGMPGCPAHVTADVLLLATGAAGVATYSAMMPSNAALAGSQFHTQAIVFDAGNNAFGAVTSDAATATLGN